MSISQPVYTPARAHTTVCHTGLCGPAFGAIQFGQEALADKAGLHRTYISMLERGQRTPSLEVVRRLAEALGTTMASLITELEESPDTSEKEEGRLPPGRRRKEQERQ